MALKFEWDEAKAAANLEKHQVSFDEASTVFADPLAKLFFDEDHSAEEEREIIVGHSLLGRLVLVSFTERGRNRIRIISAESLPEKNVKIMKKIKEADLRSGSPDDLRPEYQFDYRKARPNRFAGQGDNQRLVVALDPDVSKVFTTPESVNAVLRALIEVMPQSKRRTRVSR